MRAVVRSIAPLIRGCGGTKRVRVYSSVPIGRIAGCLVDNVAVVGDQDQVPDDNGVRMRIWTETNQIHFFADFGALTPLKCPPGVSCYGAAGCGTAKGILEKRADTWSATPQ
jgi:hypothetical protein